VLLDVHGLLPSSAQCHLLTVVRSGRIDPVAVGNVDAVALSQIREVIRDLIDPD
jgi:hypothetical protein